MHGILVPWLPENTTASNGFLFFTINIIFFVCNFALFPYPGELYEVIKFPV